MQGSYTGSGEGFVQLGGGDLVVGAGGASFNFPAGMFQWTAGVIDARTAPLTNRGSMTLPDFGIQPQLVRPEQCGHDGYRRPSIPGARAQSH